MIHRPLLLALTLTTAFGAQAAVSDEVLQAVRSSVLPVDIKDAKGGIVASLSGLATGKEEVTIPCLPLVQSAAITVREESGPKEGVWTHADPARNLCLLKVKGLEARPLTPASTKDLSPGMPVYLLGQLLGLGTVAAEGKLRGLSHAEDGSLQLQVTPHVFPGSDGGGIFDAQHRLLGMLQLTLPAMADYHSAIAADALENFKQRATPTSSPEVSAPEPNWQNAFDDAIERHAWAELELLARKNLYLYPDNPRGLTYLGLALLNGPLPPTAIPYLRLAIKKDGQAYEAQAYLAAAHLTNGDAADAETLARSVVAARPGLAPAHAVLGDILKADGRWAEAAAAYEQACRLLPSMVDYWLKLAQARQALDQWPAAAQAQRIAFNLDPTNEASKSALIQSLSRLARWDEVKALEDNKFDLNSALKEAQAARLAKRTQQAERLYRSLLIRAPQSQALLESYASFLIQQKRLDEADKLATDGAALDNKNWAFPRLKGQILLLQGDAAAAEPVLQNVVEKSKDDLEAWRLLYLVRDARRDYPGALAAIQQVMEKTADKPLDKETRIRDLIYFSRPLLILGQLDKAEAALNQVLAEDPENTDALTAKAALLGRRGKPEEAIALTNKVLARNPKSVPAMSNKGFALLQLKQVTAAQEVLEQAGQLSPRESNVLVNLAQVYLRQGRVTWAQPLLEQATKMVPRSEDLRHQLMIIYTNAAQFEKAAAQQTEWAKLFPESPRAIYWGALIAAREGDMKAVNAAYGQLEKQDAKLAANLRDFVEKLPPPPPPPQAPQAAPEAPAAPAGK